MEALIDIREVKTEDLKKIDLDQVDINLAPPENEPNRQYYFMAKCRRYVKAESERLGRSLLACVQTFGCQMNAKDSEKLAGILSAIGYQETEKQEADLVLYNTCTVRENANTKVFGRIGYLGTLKRKNPGMKIVLCGCMMQEPHVVEKIRKSYRFVDLVFGTHNIFKLAELLYQVLEEKEPVIDIWEKAAQSVEELPSEHKYRFKAGVNIMYGCDNFCSYCIVPYVRGRERSRKPEDILREVEALANEGILEVMLLGQNVNSYGKGLDEPTTFAELLRGVERIDAIRRIRFMTSHPKDLSDELIEVMRQSDKICRHLHLPMQSGSSRILQNMNRRYTKEEYLSLVGRIRSAMPDLSLTTDIIVGFPGETEEDFLETLDVVRRVGFDSAYTFLYSRRNGTPAAKLPQVPEEVAQERFERLLAEIRTSSERRVSRYTGRTMEVLVEESDGYGKLTGRLSSNLLVHFSGSAELIGKLVPVTLKECRGFYYIGELVQKETQ